GGAALLRTAELAAVGGVPASFFCYYEDTDTSWRLRLAGGRVISEPAAKVLHLHGVSTAPGSRAFHLWNERNRLLTLLRCAPARVAAAQVLRFAALTALLPLRRNVPAEHNFRFGLRLRVVAEVIVRLPATLRQRLRVTLAEPDSRDRVWHDWAGRS
ncbi:MAG: glycosyltransferase family 2 protein, partial [Actinomycetota bacterium]|nr:glycosyltransferase family 2 protein [Actinomycetota bacterium]